MRIDQFDLVRPASVDEACAVLAEHGPEARAISGGTDLLVRMKQGIVSPRLVVDVKAIPGLSYIQADGDGGLRIGAATTLRAVEKSAAVREGFAALAQAAERVASVQLRNMGTLGGNICLETMCWYYNQSRAWKRAKPACTKAGGETCYVANRAGICYATYRGDTATALMALGAGVRLQRQGGQRIVPLEEFFTGDGQVPNVLTPGELMTEILLPAQPAGSRSVYLKLSHRAAVDYPLVAVGAMLAMSGDRCADARIVLGAEEGRANHALAKELGISRPTLLLWRQRYVDAGVAGLLRDAPRPGRDPGREPSAAAHRLSPSARPAFRGWASRARVPGWRADRLDAGRRSRARRRRSEAG